MRDDPALEVRSFSPFALLTAGVVLAVGALIWRAPTRGWVAGRVSGGKLYLEVGTGLDRGVLSIGRRFSREIAEVDWIHLSLKVLRKSDEGAGRASVSLEDAVGWLERSRWTVTARLAENTRSLEVSFRATVGTGNAVTTALACGALRSAAGVGLTYLEGRWGLVKPPEIDIHPHYEAPYLEAEFACIAFLRVGDIITAGWLMLWDRVRATLSSGWRPPIQPSRRTRPKGGSRWNIRSRAS